MSTPAEIAYIKLMCIRADLASLDTAFAKGDHDGRFFANIRNVFVVLVNVDDVRREVAALVRTNAPLVASTRSLGQRLQPVRRLRNVVGGHLSNEIVEIALREEPILLLAGMNPEAIQYLSAIRIVDAALNHYLDPAGNPLIFGGDTDLVYPPDMERFLTWLGTLVGDTLSWLDVCVTEVGRQVDFVTDKGELMSRYRFAGQGSAGRPPR